MYHGTPEHRTELRATRMQPPASSGVGHVGKGGPRGKAGNYRNRSNTTAEFPVIVTTYEICIKDRQYLSNLLWKFIVVDEGHRLKNLDCKCVPRLRLDRH